MSYLAKPLQMLFFCAIKSDCFLKCMLITNWLIRLSRDLLEFSWFSLERCHKREQSVSKQGHCFLTVQNHFLQWCSGCISANFFSIKVDSLLIIAVTNFIQGNVVDFSMCIRYQRSGCSLFSPLG